MTPISKIRKELTFILSNLNNFHSLEVVDRVTARHNFSLDYSSAVWDLFRQKDIDKLVKNQRSATRFVTENYRQTASVTSLIQNLGFTRVTSVSISTSDTGPSPDQLILTTRGQNFTATLCTAASRSYWEKSRFFQNDGLTECKITRFMLLPLTLLKMR